MRYTNADTYSDGDGNSDRDANSYADSDGNSDFNANSYANAVIDA
jgi:hypothetical protein